MILRETFIFLVIFSGIYAIDLFELPMNLAGFMSIERASDACEDRINEAVELTLEAWVNILPDARGVERLAFLMKFSKISNLWVN